jgi:hypothetical protein
MLVFLAFLRFQLFSFASAISETQSRLIFWGFSEQGIGPKRSE